MAREAFKLPEGFQPPEGKKDGDTVEVMATIKLLGGGNAELQAVDGETIGGDAEEVEEGESEGGQSLWNKISQPQQQGEA